MSDLHTRIADLLTEHQREPDGNWGWRCRCRHGLTGETDDEIDQQMGDHQADAVIAELGLREERWKSNDPMTLRGSWTRHCTDWTPPTDGKADDD